MELEEKIKIPSMDIIHLEQQVEGLIHTCTQLRDENRSLRQRQEHLVAERAELIEKTELARTRVEAMITRLKAMESGQ
jgi:cell division protein ZapB